MAVAYTLMVDQIDRWSAAMQADPFEVRAEFERWLHSPVREAGPVTDDEILRDALGLRRAG